MRDKLILLFFPILLSGCGGGGGSSVAVVQQPASYYQSAEYNAQYGLGNINAAEIYSDGYSGSGVTVAVIDTGVDLDHSDLADNIASGGYDYVDNDSDANANGQGVYMSHGTHVAGIIAGVKNDTGMHGVAYSAKILALRAGNSAGSLSSSAIESSIDQAISQGAKVINVSFGSSSILSSTANKWLSAHNNDIVSVHAAGNSSLSDPSYGAKLPVDSGYEALADSLIAVVATDSSNTIASYSNKCGVAMQWCMAAPGSSVYSTVDTDDNNYNDDYATFDGTSMAAPHVSGAVAVLRSKWPSKTAAETVTILYDTATDLGATGVDVIYGRGLLNLDNAVYAQGALTVQTASGGSHYLSDSSFSSSSVLGSALSQSLEIAVYDKYKRDYYFNLNSAVSTPDPLKISDELKFSDSNFEIDLEPGMKLSSELNKGSIQIQNNYKDIKISFSDKQPASKVFAFNNEARIAGLSDTYSLYSDSHLSQINNAKIINISSTGNTKTSLGVVSGYTDKSSTHSINGVNVSVLINPTKDSSLIAQISHLEEDDTFLSNYFSGAYQTGIAKTKSINLIARSKVNDHLVVVAQYNKGRTSVNTLENSVVSNISTIDSSGYSASLVGADVYSKGDTLFATYKQPTRVENGDMILTTANGLNMDDSISFVDQTVSLSPIASEKILTVGYSTDYSKDAAMTVLLNYRDNPNHDATAKSENQMMIKINKKF
ncbi:MAG: S8 family serine peptidase [Candidatus Thioglobus sp.]|uniref:S8 family peptidase n=1 Tax=Candidatus Thioglobus sp. TaxID=2026721 RepID=UPI00260E47F0|nr:S8 family peptidase [Candidatus Thioglobus sp.]MDC9727465.1 S8 family serine peptidase [Candidatus Thioglobus sp.]